MDQATERFLAGFTKATGIPVVIEEKKPGAGKKTAQKLRALGVKFVLVPYRGEDPLVEATKAALATCERIAELQGRGRKSVRLEDSFAGLTVLALRLHELLDIVGGEIAEAVAATCGPLGVSFFGTPMPSTHDGVMRMASCVACVAIRSLKAGKLLPVGTESIAPWNEVKQWLFSSRTKKNVWRPPLVRTQLLKAWCRKCLPKMILPECRWTEVEACLEMESRWVTARRQTNQPPLLVKDALERALIARRGGPFKLASWQSDVKCSWRAALKASRQLQDDKRAVRTRAGLVHIDYVPRLKS